MGEIVFVVSKHLINKPDTVDDPVPPEQRRKDLTCHEHRQNKMETQSQLPHPQADHTEVAAEPQTKIIANSGSLVK